MILANLILLAAQLPATTYGFGEIRCGDAHAPKACKSGAVTASGMIFHPDILIAAVPAPVSFKLRLGATISVETFDGKCIKIHLADKKNFRYIASASAGGFDFSPAAQRAITGKAPSRSWRGRIQLCGFEIS